ncbi:glycine cleavage system protein GcvH [Candidatus Bipolaricaulota bacterium]|nr:glycine cleavage system protein GcvH [Candidatus Bipolaricaulota bacterium]TFH08979.1 MAG: glycine cleavage system protein GcvH [Candidatus Atribacteria bacterium]
MGYPAEYRYTKAHEWIHLQGNQARIGITQHAQAELGDIVFVELPAVGTAVQKGDNVATVESVKAVGDVFAPVAGTVVDVNADLESAPETINSSPHESGWILVLEIADPSELDDALDVAAYESFIAGE